ncbi:S8 family peptidase [Clostridium sp.]|uniref:S8 family peptidase n=1 Tax=Clostridium sp. TaxID=1506 RepID=UPI002FCB10ED
MSDIDEKFFQSFKRELDDINIQKGLTQEEANKFFFDENYQTYFVEYIGDIAEGIANTDYARLYLIDKFFAVLFVRRGMISEVLRNFPQIINLEKSFPFTLLSLNESTDLPDLNALYMEDDALDGNGIIVGIIGTGIDYLNSRFMNADKSTRIVSIWDQSLAQGPFPEAFPIGTEFTRANINDAIKTSIQGGNPYDVVNHRDEVGYGTAIAGIIGASDLGTNVLTAGIAPKCEFSIVKLKPAKKSNLELWGLENYQGNVYDSNDIVACFRYFSQLQEKLRKPMVVYAAAGTNLGGHDGGAITERYIDSFTANNNFSVVTSTGDQGASPVHISGSFLQGENEKEIELNVDPQQETLNFFLYFVTPDIISVGITSPSGDSIEKIDVKPINGEEVIVNLGESTIVIQYFTEAIGSTDVKLDQRIDFFIRNTTSGVWKLKLIGEYLSNRTYDLWLIQSEFLKGSTGFIGSIPNTTLMTPSTAKDIIVCSSFDQVSSKLRMESGRGFTRDGRILPTIALPSQNIRTVGINNRPIVVSGTAVSGAILAGIVTLLLQWGIVLKNDVNMYSSKIKSYLILAASKVEGEVYPNIETGFGVLYIQNLIKMLNGETNQINRTKKLLNKTSNEEVNSLFIRIPEGIFKRLKT